MTMVGAGLRNHCSLWTAPYIRASGVTAPDIDPCTETRMRTRTHLLRWMLVLCALFLARPLAAQVCIGVPINPGELALAGTAAFPSGADVYGARMSYGVSSRATVGGFYQLENYA